LKNGEWSDVVQVLCSSVLCDNMNIVMILIKEEKVSVTFRNFTAEIGFSQDFQLVRDFLVRINAKNPLPQYHFEWGRWEWAFSLPFLDTANQQRIGIWEDGGEMVALATFEDKLGSAYLCVDTSHQALKPEMLAYAREYLCDGDGKIKVLINNADRAFQLAAARLGFVPTQSGEAVVVMDIDAQRIHYTLPPGFTVASLADDLDLYKFNRVLWRGFNHEGEPPTTPQDMEERRVSLSGPHLDHELCIVVVSPKGEYASYCGMWYDEATEYALVEPVATDPTYRKMGLGRAAVLEAVRRCGLRGAKQAYVGSSQQFYYRIGFHPLPAGTFWETK